MKALLALSLALLTSASCSPAPVPPAASPGQQASAPGAPRAEARTATEAEAKAELARVGSGEAPMREAVLSMLEGGSYFLPFDRRPFADPASRERLVRSLGPALRWLVSTDAFRAAYAERRRALLEGPAEGPEAEARSAAQIQAELIRAQEDAIRAIEEQSRSKELPADVRKDLARAAAEQKKQLAELKKKAGKLAAEAERAEREAREAERAERAGAASRRAEERQRLARDFPEEPEALIARRLTELLIATSSIAWDAELVEERGRRRFASPDLEAKPPEWKLAFRAGRAATEAARAFAEAWRDELRAKGAGR